MSNPTRFPNGIALGYYNQFNAYGRDIPGVGQGTLLAGQQMTGNTGGLLAQASTAPDVSLGSLFYSNNSSATVISLLRTQQIGRAGALQASGQIDTTAPPPEGKILRVFFLDGNTSFAQGGSTGIGNIILSSSDNRTGANNITDFMASNGSWYQVGASNPSSGMGISTVSIGTATSVNMSGVNLLFVTGTATPVQVKAISGGQVGQVVTFVGLGSSGISAYVMTGGNINIVGTNSFLIPNSGALQFIKINASLWNMYEVGTSGGVQ